MMDVINKLASVGVAPMTELRSIACSSYARDSAHPSLQRRQSISDEILAPLVSCLMVTRGDRWTIKYALESYRRQTYDNRELIIVVDRQNREAVSALIEASHIDRVSLFGVDRELTLGDCRNMSVARARGDILVQWDDDDLYDPLRIDISVSALIRKPAAAALLSRWLVWWPSRELAAISGTRTWEGSIAVWREQIPVYPSIDRGEDTYITECIANWCDVSMMDAPLSYVYIVTGKNAFEEVHYDRIMEHASYVVRGHDYRKLIELLSDRIPISEYGAELLSRAHDSGAGA
jgi:glycosyltransferase involved in cell wall biosynthesis